ncbi:long-chain-fatty-acid--CoA ligase [Streptomyces anthocyanicus]|uniref:long-chain-fatty-acid--CoA ligase n=1 Tax=Streptomyces anthocyanicus TaxID=68174 RepID=UPI0037FA1F34
MTTSWTGPADVKFAGTMMNEPLLLKSIAERAEQMYGDQRVVGYTDRGPVETSCAALVSRVRRLASALVRSGVEVGDRIATFAWNTLEHLELCLAVPSVGAVLTPLNVRLHADALRYIIDHAGVTVVVADHALADRLPPLPDRTRLVVIGPADDEAGALDYEQLIADGDPGFDFPRIPEESASTLCYTGGTTGPPKGVAYTHRSTVLHTLLECLPDYYAISEADVTVPYVPFFHANAWGIPYASLMVGARLVLPGRPSGPEAMVRLLAEQRATFSAGVPTIWHDVGELPALPDLSALRMVVVGGAPLSERFLKRFDALGVPVMQGFGMTEANPLVAIGSVPARSTAEGHDRMRVRLSQGRPLPFVDVRVDESAGELQMRGATVTARYYGQSGKDPEKFTDDGWMRTGDVAEISADGVVRIVDRTKDMIKSGGEWIPSVELADAIEHHPAVAEAVVVAVGDERWGERPAAFVVLRPGAALTADALRAHLAERVAKWWIPEAIHFADHIPRTSLGKLDKRAVRLLVDGLVPSGTDTEEERTRP